MDTPTIIVLVACAAALGIMFVPRERSLGLEVAAITAIWLLFTLGGEFLFGWAGNATCSRFLGCVEGFAGYDAFEHLFFGVACALALLWSCRCQPKYSILLEERWKAALVVIATIALIAVCWEILEYLHDAVRLDFFREPLVNWRLHINQLDQPTNADTIGDITFTLAGSIVGFTLRRKER